MKDPSSIISKLIKKGKDILAKIPKKTKISQLQANIKEKYGKDPKHQDKVKLQLKFLKEDYQTNIWEANKKYSEWFIECADIIEKLNHTNYSSILDKTKQELTLESRIEFGINVLSDINKYLESNAYLDLSQGKESVYWKIKDLIAEGENDRIEFKSSLRWDWKTNVLNKFLEIAVTKTISAFLNSHGGILLIGVSDEGQILGLKKDYPTLKRADGDGFIQFLVQVMNNRLGKEFSQYISANIKNVEGKDLCIINVKQSPNPVFIKYDNKEEFYIRASATSQPLNVREATEYISMRW